MKQLLTGMLGLFTLIAGVNKFREPFTTMFEQQIALAGLPFPALSNWAGTLGEITAGATLLLLLLVGKKLTTGLTDAAFYLANLLVIGSMSVAIYVHLHPDVPADILPFESKPPVTPVVTLLLATLNMLLYRPNVRACRSPSPTAHWCMATTSPCRH